MKRILIGGASVLALVIGGALVAPSFIDWSKYKQPAIDAALNMAGYDVTVDGAIGLSILPSPSLHVDNVTVRLPGQVTDKDKYLAHFDRLSVSVALLPLLTGMVTVNDVELVKPDLHVTLDENGQPDWLTPKVRTLTGMANVAAGSAAPADANAAPAATTGGTGAFKVGVDHIGIRDGSITLIDQKNKQTYNLQAINTTAQMDSLKGPFGVKGDVIYNTVPLKWQADIGQIADISSDVPVNAKISAPDHGTTVTYAGVLTQQGGMGAQGQLDITGRNWVPALSAILGQPVPAPDQPLAIKGLLTATERNITFDNMTVSYGDLAMDGVIKARLPDLKTDLPLVYARLSSKDVVQVQKLMATFGQSSPKSATSAPAKKSTIKSAPAATAFKLPADLDIEVKAPGLQMASEPIRDVTITVNAKSNDIKGRMIAGQIPGDGKLDVTAYPGEGGALMLDTKLTVADAGKLVKSGLGMAVPPSVPLQKFHDVALNTEVLLAPQRVEAKTGSVKWLGGDLAFAGSGYKTGANGRPVLTLTLGANKLDLDGLMGTTPAPKSSGAAGTAPASTSAKTNIKDMIKQSTANLKLPMDLDFSLSFGELVTGGKSVRDLNLVGTLAGDQLKIGTMSVGSYLGASMNGRGQIGSLADMNDIDMNVSAQADDAAAAMTSFGMTPPASAKDLGAAKLDVAYKGSLDQANVNGNVTLWGITAGAAGPVSDPLGTPQVSALKVTLSSPSVATAMKAFQPNFKATTPLQGPLKITADTTIKGKTYTLANVAGTAGIMSVSGDITADMSGARPKISGGLTLGDVPLDALMGVERKSAATTNTNGTISTTSAKPMSADTGTKWSTAPLNTDWMRMMDLDFSVAAKSMTYNLWVLSSPSMAVTLQSGTLSVRDAQAGMFGGTIKGNGEMKAPATGQPVSMKWSADMTGVNARSLTNAFMNKAMNKMDGTVAMNFDITSNGASPAALVGGLAGSASSGGQNITINGIDVAKLTTWLTTDLKPSNTVDGLMGSFFGNGSTTFAKHEGAYTIKNGVINLDQMLFDGDQASLATTGNVGLPNWMIDTKSTLKVKNPANVPELSFNLKGSLSNPANSFGQGMFQNYLQSKLQDQLGKVVEKKFGNKLNDLGLGGLLGGQQQAPAPVVTPTAPAGTDAAPVTDTAAPIAAPAPEPKKVKPEDVLLDVLKGMGN